MRAIVQDTYGSTDVLRPAELDEPTPGDREVLVRVRAAGVDRGVLHLMEGLPYLIRPAFGLRRPRQPVPGLDLAGVVEAVGSGVTRFAAGDEVLGIGRGTFAELAVAPEKKLVPKPAGLPWERAAVLAISGLTALQAVRDHGRVAAGHKVLVIGASGGVGSYAVQIAAALGAEVTGSCSAAKADFVRGLGAARVLDYARQDFAESGQRYDVIVDINGNASLSHHRRALTPRGTLVIVGGEMGGPVFGGTERLLRAALLSPFVGQRLRGFVSGENLPDLLALTTMVEAGQVAPALDRTFPLAEAARALDYVANGRARGKVAITL